jgi:hypothetical protein
MDIEICFELVGACWLTERGDTQLPLTAELYGNVSLGERFPRSLSLRGEVVAPEWVGRAGVSGSLELLPTRLILEFAARDRVGFQGELDAELAWPMRWCSFHGPLSTSSKPSQELGHARLRFDAGQHLWRALLAARIR